MIGRQFAIENGPFVVDVPIKSGDFPVRKLLVCQRGKKTPTIDSDPLTIWRIDLQLDE